MKTRCPPDVSSRPHSMELEAEVPIAFEEREHGTSNLTTVLALRARGATGRLFTS